MTRPFPVRRANDLAQSGDEGGHGAHAVFAVFRAAADARERDDAVVDNYTKLRVGA